MKTPFKIHSTLGTLSVLSCGQLDLFDRSENIQQVPSGFFGYDDEVVIGCY